LKTKEEVLDTSYVQAYDNARIIHRTAGSQRPVCGRIKGDHLIKKFGILMEINYQLPEEGDDQTG